MEEILELLGMLSFDNAKVVISGKNVIDSGIFSKPTGEAQKEKYMGTKFRNFAKPRLEIEAVELVIPRQNPLIPTNFEIFSTETKARNDLPEPVEDDEDEDGSSFFQLTMVKDHTHRMPRAII